MWSARQPPLHAQPPVVEPGEHPNPVQQAEAARYRGDGAARRALPWRSMRRGTFLACMVVGALLMWLSPETLSGAIVMGAGIVIEAVGLIGCDRCG